MSFSFFKRHGKSSLIAVLTFVILFSCGLNNDAFGDEIAIGVGAGVGDMDGTITQRIGYQPNPRWLVRYERFGGKGEPHSNMYGIQRNVRWRQTHELQPYLTFGAVYFDSILQDDEGREFLKDEFLAYNLGLGVTWRYSNTAALRLGFDHNSTAGRADRNHGVDRVHLTFVLRVH
jgi:hypothetical protein